MRLSLCEAPTLKEQHKGQPQHRETSRPTNINRQQLFRVKRTLSGADVEQQSNKRTPATKTRIELNFSTTSLSEKAG